MMAIPFNIRWSLHTEIRMPRSRTKFADGELYSCLPDRGDPAFRGQSTSALSNLLARANWSSFIRDNCV